MPSPKNAWPRPEGATTASEAAVSAPPSQGSSRQGARQVVSRPASRPSPAPPVAASGRSDSAPAARTISTATHAPAIAGALRRSTHHRTADTPRIGISIAPTGALTAQGLSRW